MKGNYAVLKKYVPELKKLGLEKYEIRELIGITKVKNLEKTVDKLKRFYEPLKEQGLFSWQIAHFLKENKSETIEEKLNDIKDYNSKLERSEEFSEFNDYLILYLDFFDRIEICKNLSEKDAQKRKELFDEELDSELRKELLERFDYKQRKLVFSSDSEKKFYRNLSKIYRRKILSDWGMFSGLMGLFGVINNFENIEKASDALTFFVILPLIAALSSNLKSLNKTIKYYVKSFDYEE